MLAFKCYGAKVILDNGGKELLKEKFGDYYLGDTYEDYDIVLTLNPSSKPQEVKADSGASKEEKAKIKEENALIKIKLAELAEEVAEKWSSVKSEFMGAPIRKALIDVREESKENYLMEIPYRRDEKYWVRKQDTNAIVYYNINFTDPTDIALAKIFCIELKDTKKTTSNAASVTYYQKIDMSSDLMKDLKIDPKKSSCGAISFHLKSGNVTKNLETAVYFLATFRQYVEFHVRFVKCLLHNRIRKRIGKFEIVFEKAIREGVQKQYEYKTTIGGASKSDKPEEEKISGVFKKHHDDDEYTIG